MAKKLPFGGKIVLYDDICHTGIDEEALGRIYDAAIDTDPVYVVFTSDIDSQNPPPAARPSTC